MGPAPTELDGCKVIATAVVNQAVRPTGATIHEGPDGVIPTASALAIVMGEAGVYLFYCDREWQVLADTWHSSVNNAKAQQNLSTKASQHNGRMPSNRPIHGRHRRAALAGADDRERSAVRDIA